MADSEEIIILSDDDDDEKECDNDLSCLIVEVEDVKKTDCVPSSSALDEDLVVTFSRRAEVLPHARYDCPIHPFTATDCETGAPAGSNQLICEQCFCYICDKLASSCVMWCHGGLCHCNSHKRSDFWSNLRHCTLLGGLKSFNLALSEIDHHLRHAEAMLQSFRQELSGLYSFFLKGEMLQTSGPNQIKHQAPDIIYYDYTRVYEFVSSFLDKADKQESRAAAIMNLGAAEDFIKHFDFIGMVVLQRIPVKSVEPKIMLLQRVIATVQRLMVMAGFSPVFICKLQDFFKRLAFPAELLSMKNRLCIRPWNDVLLVSVMKGQNVSGVRKDKGKKDVLFEQISVVVLRTEVLQHQHRYRDLCRYLRVVKTDDSGQLCQLQDLMPFFMCMDRDFTMAVKTFFPLLNTPAFRLTPNLFQIYLRIFQTATAPKLTVTQPAQLCASDAVWEPIKDAVPLKRAELVRFALMTQRCCLTVYIDSQCWTSLLTIVNTPCGSLTALPPPSFQFLHEAGDVVNMILLDQHGFSIQIPRYFQEAYPDQALLLLVTGALSLRILHSPLFPVIPVLNTFKENAWAIRWLCDRLSYSNERFSSFVQEVAREVQNTKGNPLAVKLNCSQVKTSSQSWLAA